MVRNLDEDEKDTQSLLTLGGEQECLIINESGLYNAVLSITKRNSERYTKARQFKKWITNEVIPIIRSTGGFVENGREEEFIAKYFPSFSVDVQLAMVQDLQKIISLYVIRDILEVI
jgi:prophage antirepressor-like protein